MDKRIIQRLIDVYGKDAVSAVRKFKGGGPTGIIHPKVVMNVARRAIQSVLPKSVSKGLAGIASSGYGTAPNVKALADYYRYGVQEDWDPGIGFLMSPDAQREYMEGLGYHLVDDREYGMVNKAATRLRDGRGDDIPIYQLGEDDIDPGNVDLVTTDPEEIYKYYIRFPQERLLRNAGSYPMALYKDKNSDELYVKQWDLNDYGQHKKVSKTVNNYSGATTYGPRQWLAEAYDFVGRPFVQRSGLVKLLSEEEGWKQAYGDAADFSAPITALQTVAERAKEEYAERIRNGEYASGGKIHIAPSKRGTFTAAARKRGKSVQAFASQVLAHKENYSPAMVKKANFARNAAKWHGEGGLIGRLQKAYGSAALEKVIGVRKFALGGPEGEGGYTTSVAEREAVRAKWDPAHGFNIPGFLWSWSNGNQSKGEENEYWRAYLGLENNVPRMSPEAKTEWDDTIESDKAASGEPLSDFYGTTPRMDQMLQVLADTLNTGKIVRNYAAYKERYPELADKVVFEHMYDQGKQVLDNPGKWTQVVEGPQMYLDEKIEKVTNEKMPLGMLADFGMKWLPDEGKLMVHDTYDFPKHVTAISDIPVRPKEMKIRGRISFDPKKGSILLRNGVWHKDKYAEPIANKYSH